MSAATSSFRPNGLLGGLLGDAFSGAQSASSPGAGPSTPPPATKNAPNDDDEYRWEAMDEMQVDGDLQEEDYKAKYEAMNSAAQLQHLLELEESTLATKPPPVTSSSFIPTGLLGPTPQLLPPPSPPPPSSPDEANLELPPPPAAATATVEPTLPSYKSISAQTFNGKTVYIRKKYISTFQRRSASTALSSTGMRNLLDVPIHRMLDQLSLEAATLLSNKEMNINQGDANAPSEQTLWVDRYRPSRFTELVGNERVARDILAWVKQWDYCVFGKNSVKGKKRARDDENVNMEDEYRRPKEKILLLSGPPGLGKTTMAHVLAQHAGYEVMEINASDARSGSIVDDRIRPALESGSTVGSTKPVLLVIDEIDGATGAGDQSSSFIYKLVQLTYDRSFKKSRGKDKNAKRPILRPIICICNDINASSLIKLKPHAFQVRLQRPADIHTVKRLKQVCEDEGLRADSRALSTLVGIAKGDLRGCINTLQFIKARNEEVNESVIRKATSGMKEGDTTIMAVLNDVFSPLSKKRVKELGMTEEEESKFVGRLSRLIDSCGRDSSIAIACFSHYANLRQHDGDFNRYHKANEWLVTFDTFSSAMYSEGEFALNMYLPYMLVPFHHLFQERGGPRIERDQTDWEILQTTRANEEIYKSLGRCLQNASTRHGGDFRHLVSTPIMQLEFAPYINRIIAPPLRPVNFQIIKPQERAVMKRLVSIMAALDLRFVPERTEDGQLAYRLDPAVDVFITYEGKRASDINLSRYAVRKLVAEEIDLEIASRSSEVVEKGKRGKHADMFGGGSKKPTEKASPTKGGAQDDDDSGPSKKRQKIQAAEAVDIADRPPVDFFGRLINVKAGSKSTRLGAKYAEKKFRIVYKYAEGNSAAVRKAMKMEAFL